MKLSQERKHNEHIQTPQNASVPLVNLTFMSLPPFSLPEPQTTTVLLSVTIN